jgi:tRNA (cytidine/uridine-2'-O-)-methyltransferase
MRLALYQPDIPPNTGTLLRLGACLGVPIDIIMPCGFPIGDRDLKRAAMDYAAKAECRRHESWLTFAAACGGRLVLLSTRATTLYTEFRFSPDDTLLVGRETDGVPDDVHRAADARIRVPMVAGVRSLNVAVAAAIVLGEALRQTGLLPTTAHPTEVVA